jgi:ABC-type iron transport system FetAB permease component
MCLHALTHRCAVGFIINTRHIFLRLGIIMKSLNVSRTLTIYTRNRSIAKSFVYLWLDFTTQILYRRLHIIIMRRDTNYHYNYKNTKLFQYVAINCYGNSMNYNNIVISNTRRSIRMRMTNICLMFHKLVLTSRIF